MSEFLEIESLRFSRRLQNGFGRARRSRLILDNISLRFNEGERVAILGKNGAGKTTLLRLMAGIFIPDSGVVRRSSPASALLDGGYGMVEALSARENCESRLVMLRTPRVDIDNQVAEIEDLVEIGEYFDQPIHTLSNGMFARVVFGVATMHSPRILLIDEGIGFADEYFRRKAVARLEKLFDSAAIVVNASHNLEYLREVCTRGIVIHNQQKVFDGQIADALSTYKSLLYS